MFLVICCFFIILFVLWKHFRRRGNEVEDNNKERIWFHVRDGKSIEVDEAFMARSSGNLKRMLDAVDLDTNPIDRHFLLQSIVMETYKNRSNPKMREICKKIGAIHISEFGNIAPMLRKEIGVDGVLPSVPTFKNLATVLTEDQEFDKALEVCSKALAFDVLDGTIDGFEGRIRKIKKKQQLSQNMCH